MERKERPQGQSLPRQKELELILKSPAKYLVTDVCFSSLQLSLTATMNQAVAGGQQYE